MGPAQSVGFDNTLSRAHISNVMRETVRLVPSLATARVVRGWVGWFEMTPDDLPIIEQPEGIAGLYVCAGFSGHGFALSPAIGRLMAALMLDGHATHPIDELGLARFGQERAAGAHDDDSPIARLGRLTAEGLH
jgi:sarcosine oxidase, subunit beta